MKKMEIFDGEEKLINLSRCKQPQIVDFDDDFDLRFLTLLLVGRKGFV